MSDQYKIQHLSEEQGDRQSDEDQNDGQSNVTISPRSELIRFGENTFHFTPNCQIFSYLPSVTQLLINDLIVRNHFEGLGDGVYSTLTQIWPYFELQNKNDAVATLPMITYSTLRPPLQTSDGVCPMNNGDLVLLDTNDEFPSESLDTSSSNDFPYAKHILDGNKITEMQTMPTVNRKQDKINSFEDGAKRGKCFSENGNDYIEWEGINDRFVQINSCQFHYSNDGNTSRTIYMRKRTTDHLLIIDEEKFLAEVKIVNIKKSEFFQTKSFQCKQKIIQNLTKINRIIDDDACGKRNNAYAKLINFLKYVSQKTAQNLVFAEDFFQFSFFKNNKNLIDFLFAVTKNDNISNELKNVIQKFLDSHKALYYRSKIEMFCTDDMSIVRNLRDELHMIYDQGINQHRQSLRNYSNLSNDMIKDLNALTVSQVLQLSNQDVKLYSDLLSVTSQHKHPTIQVCGTESINILWKKLITKIKGNPFQNFFFPIKSLNRGSATNPIYLYLFKSSMELIEEISNRTNIPIEKLIVISDPGKLKLIKDIPWPVRCMLNHALETQFSFILKAMNHFIPGSYSKNITFEHELSDNRTLAMISEERKIWYYMLHDTLSEIFNYQKNSSENFRQFLDNLLQGYRNLLIKSKDDRFESFRVCAHSIVKFSLQICLYFDNRNSMFETFDQKILKQQIEFIIKTLSSDHSGYLQNFMNSIDIFSKYWQHRVSIIEKIPQKYIEFELFLKDICHKLLAIVSTSLDTTMHIQTIVNFFRLFNEFLKYIEATNVQWLVNENNSCIDTELFYKLSGLDVVALINDRKKSYRVLNPKLFIEIIKFKGTEIIPKHYVLEVIKRLLDVVIESLSNHDLNATSDLILTIGHSLIYVKDQHEYVDFDNFFDDITKPFINVIRNCQNYRDLQSRLANIEKLYVYSRKQDEIDLVKSLDLYEQETLKLSDCGFKTDFDRSILLSCYGIYEKQFDMYMEMDDINEILVNISTYISQNIPETRNVTEWTSDFKQNTIPLILAGAAAVWSILESEDIACTKKIIKPHSIQIICILRLLNVDNASNGIENHLAQVLTGQGKSIVLGLLSSVIALTGHNVEVVCYSDYLADRDQEAFTDFRKYFDLNDRVKYKTFDKIANEFFNISKGVDTRNLAEDLILNKLEKQTLDFGKIERKTCLLIDEVDVFFTDDFYGSTYNPVMIVGLELLIDVQFKIWKLVKAGVHDSNTVLNKINELIFQLKCQHQNEKVKEFDKAMSNNQVFLAKQLKLMIEQALMVAKSRQYHRNKYKIDDRGIICFRGNNGIYYSNCFNEYHNIFHYFRLKKTDFDHKDCINYGYLLLNVGQISYAKLPLEYSIKLGVTGTLTTLNNPEKDAVKSYNINTISSMPSFFGGGKLIFDHKEHFSIQDTVESWLNEILNRINAIIQSGRSVLVFFDEENKINKFKEKFQSNINRLHIITGNEPTAMLESYVSESGVAHTVTLGTRQMGRGVDYKSNDSSVEKNGGVHVIQTFFSLDEKEEIQIKGRTARKDNSGSYELIVCREHLKQLKCSEKNDGPIHNYEQLCAIRTNKAHTQGLEICAKIQQADEKHNQTKEFLKSLSEYRPENRNDYITKYPFV